MNIFKKTIAAFALCLMLAACSTADSEKAETPVATPAPTMNPNMVPQQNETPPEEPIADMYPDSGYTFALTAEEKDVYEQLKAQLTTDVFEGLSPISVAKIYIQCGIDGEWEAEYTCHSQDSMPLTKEDWHQKHIEDLAWSVLESRQSLANWVFPLIDEGEVKEEGNEATIIYHSIPEINFDGSADYDAENTASPEPTELTPEQQAILDEEILNTYNEFHLIKNSSGIWEVRHSPFQLDYNE